MEQHLSEEFNSILDPTNEIRKITLGIVEAFQENNENLVEKLLHDLIILINSHQDKYEAVAFAIIHCRHLMDQYRAKARGYSHIAKYLKDRLQDHINQKGCKELDTQTFRFWIKENLYPTVIVDIPAEELPEEFYRIQADKIKLREALSNGKEIEGVTLELGEHLRVTVKVSLQD